MRSIGWPLVLSVLLVSGCGKPEEKPAATSVKETVPPVSTTAASQTPPATALAEKPTPLAPTPPLTPVALPIVAPSAPAPSSTPPTAPQAQPLAVSTLATATAPAASVLGSRNESAAPGSAGASLSLSDLSQDQVTRGLKEALGRGLQQAIGSLATPGGFLTNLAVKIPMPEKLQSIEKTLRSLRQDRLADEFVATMNQAAEKAVPAAAEVFTGSLKRMSVDDAKRILTGPADAATQYFRKANTAELTQRFLPIVQQETAKSGATAAFKQLMDKASLAAPFTKVPVVDLDGYVTEKALDGLFTLVAAEEKHIRENPVARTTDLLKSVFGALKK